MVAQWCDDFNSYGTSTSLMLNGLYAEIDTLHCALAADPDPNATGMVLRLAIDAGATGISIRRVFTGTLTTAGAAFRLWLNHLPGGTSGEPAIEFMDASNNMVIRLRVTPTGQITLFYPGGSSTTPDPILVANAWQHIEIKAVADDTVGSIEVRVEGLTVLTISDDNTGDGYAQWGCRFIQSTTQTLIYYIKDLVCWDGTGDHNNDFMGSVTVGPLVPDSDVVFPWAPSTGTTGFNLIDIAPPVDATSYISAGDPPPDPAVFGLSDLPSDVTSVRFLQTLVRARKTDGGDGNLQVSLLSGSDAADGADRPITTAFTYWFDISETDPATDAPWAPAAVDAAQLQINRTL